MASQYPTNPHAIHKPKFSIIKVKLFDSLTFYFLLMFYKHPRHVRFALFGMRATTRTITATAISTDMTIPATVMLLSVS